MCTITSKVLYNYPGGRILKKNMFLYYSPTLSAWASLAIFYQIATIHICICQPTTGWIKIRLILYKVYLSLSESLSKKNYNIFMWFSCLCCQTFYSSQNVNLVAN